MPKSDEDDNSALMNSLEGVRRLKCDRVDLHQQRPKAKVRVQRTSSLNKSLSNSIIPVSTESAAVAESFFQPGLSKKLQRSIRSGKQEIDAVIDLHGYRQHQALSELDQFLRQALQHRLKFLLIIHGKGFRSQSDAVLRTLVQRWLLAQPMVLGFCPAQPRDGGYGASYAYLKSSD